MFERLLRNVSITKKLILIVMISSSVALILAGIFFVVYDYVGYRDTMVRNLSTLTEVLASNSTAALSFSSKTDAAEILSALKTYRHVTSAAIFTDTGELFASFQRSGINESLLPRVDARIGATFEPQSVIYATPISLEGENLGKLVVCADLGELQERFSRNTLLIGIVVLVAILFAFGIVRRLQRLVSQPIVRLAQTANAVSNRGDYSLRAAEGGRDEVGTLIKTFNEMLAQIQLRDEEVKAARDCLEVRVHERTQELEAEIAERVRAEESIRRSLEEKDLLLKEVHHRVKNNLQIITSLLNLQAGKITDGKLEAMFRDSQGRVKSMALIHEKLYQSENLSEINFSEYVDSLCKYLLSTISGNLGRIRVVNDVENIRLGIDVAIPCGLIINELVTNSLKYAFPGSRAGVIRISCRQKENDRLELAVSDDGVGFPATFNLNSTASLGMQLIQSLTDQLDGRLTCADDGGARFSLEFDRDRRRIPRKEPANV